MVQAQHDITEFQLLAVVDRDIRGHHPGPHRRLVGPLFHQGPPHASLHALDFGDGAGVGMDRHVAVSLDESLVTEEMVAVVVGVDDRHDRLPESLLQLADGHLADLHRRPGIDGDQAPGRIDEAQVAHHPLVFRGRETVGRMDHPDMLRQLPLGVILDRRAADEVVEFAGQGADGLPGGEFSGTEGGQGGAGTEKVATIHQCLLNY